MTKPSIPQEITYLAQEATSPHNSGYEAEVARKRLEAIKVYIEKVLAGNRKGIHEN